MRKNFEQEIFKSLKRGGLGYRRVLKQLCLYHNCDYAVTEITDDSKQECYEFKITFYENELKWDLAAKGSVTKYDCKKKLIHTSILTIPKDVISDSMMSIFTTINKSVKFTVLI